MSAAKFYKCLSDETRLRCLLLLGARDALCVCDFAEALGSSQPKISRHLAQLRACGLVSDHREKQWVYYRIHPDLPAWQQAILADTGAALRSESPFADDLRRLVQAERRITTSRCP